MAVNLYNENIFLFIVVNIIDEFLSDCGFRFAENVG